MRVTFWGVRGSCPTPHPSVLRYGGNTPCLEVRVDTHRLILDAGTGLRNLVTQLLAEDGGAGLDLHLLLSHYHWAHIQGLPFLEPVWLAKNRVSVYGPWLKAPTAPSLGALLKNLFSAPFFSGDAERAQSALAARELAPDSDFRVGSAWIRTCPTNHPGGTLAYRVDHGGSSLVYAPDHQPGQRASDHRLISFARGADLLVCDAQLDPDDSSDSGNARGHGSWLAAVELAREAQARQLALFHHAPLRSDAEVDAFVRKAREKFPNVVAAGEGMIADLDAGRARIWGRTGRVTQRVPFPATGRVRPVEPDGPGDKTVHLRDISVQGAYFLGNQSYDLNESLHVLVELPSETERTPAGEDAGAPTAAPTPQWRLRGTVARVEPRTVNGNRVGVGVRFAESPAVDILHLPEAKDDSEPN